MLGGPLIAALIVIPLTQGWAGLRKLGSRMIRWRVRWYWYVVAIGLPLAVVLVTAMLNVALGAEAPSLVQFGTVIASSWCSWCAWWTPEMGRWARRTGLA